MWLAFYTVVQVNQYNLIEVNSTQPLTKVDIVERATFTCISFDATYFISVLVSL